MGHKSPIKKISLVDLGFHQVAYISTSHWFSLSSLLKSKPWWPSCDQSPSLDNGELRFPLIQFEITQFCVACFRRFWISIYWINEIFVYYFLRSWICRRSREGTVAATSTAVATPNSSAAPTAVNAAPRYIFLIFFNSLWSFFIVRVWVGAACFVLIALDLIMNPGDLILFGRTEIWLECSV